jgi:tRNA uridine 5-carboxymethylaminomethyl modification enzyme
VLIDDLVTKGTREPYRMFTSRAEYRLLLRADNADLRLTPMGEAIGCISPARRQAFATKQAQVSHLLAWAHATKVKPASPLGQHIAAQVGGMNSSLSVFEALKRPSITLSQVKGYIPEFPSVSGLIEEQLEVEAHYDGYLQRQEQSAQRLSEEEALEIPTTTDYTTIAGLSKECQQKLADHQPPTLAAAGRISGITPAALQAVWLHLRRQGTAASSAPHPFPTKNA